MNKYQRFALNHYLAEYPQELTFEQVLELLEAGDGKALVWQPFECLDKAQVAECIDNMTAELEHSFPNN